MPGIVDTGALVEKGHNFLQVLEPIFNEFLAVIRKLGQRDKQDFCQTKLTEELRDDKKS